MTNRAIGKFLLLVTRLFDTAAQKYGSIQSSAHKKLLPLLTQKLAMQLLPHTKQKKAIEVNYYQFHIGDYRRDTMHLSMIEHGAYRQLLDWIYLEQKPIPRKTEEVFRRLSARTDEERKAVEIVLNEMFELTDEGYIQGRVMREIDQYEHKADRARENGKAGGRPSKTKEVISGLSNKTQEKANHEPLTINHKPLTNKSIDSSSEELSLLPASPETDDGKIPKCPVKAIIASYHEILPELPTVNEFPEQAVKMLRARWRSESERQVLAWWRDYFIYVRDCPFLMGEKNDFQASLMWLVRPTNFAKVINGNYESRQAA